MVYVYLYSTVKMDTNINSAKKKKLRDIPDNCF